MSRSRQQITWQRCDWLAQIPAGAKRQPLTTVMRAWCTPVASITMCCLRSPSLKHRLGLQASTSCHAGQVSMQRSPWLPGQIGLPESLT